MEVVCPGLAEHERRAATRVADIPDLPPPTWSDTGRAYEPWDRDRLVLDTAPPTVWRGHAPWCPDSAGARFFSAGFAEVGCTERHRRRTPTSGRSR